MTAPTPTAFVVSHTHWDREWYETFQQFRLKLVDLIDQVIDLLDNQPGYEYFMLDGQAIVLEDYLAVRPEREGELRRLVQAGRLLVGPWYVLPDEFLVSPEALIRNLQRGQRLSRRFGEPMAIGYIPDPFGHISQMPQLVRGFGLETAAVARGLGAEPVELWWEAPDGSRVLLIHLREGYGNLAWVPHRADLFTAEFERRVRDYLGGAVAPAALLLNGTDHLFPLPTLPALLAAAREALPELTIRHATLPDYVAAVRAALPGGDDAALPVVRGELRSPERLHLLPGVLSARAWIKQANDAAETLLERYAEPLAAWATQLGGPSRHAQLDAAWRLLLENHPHDSICGCSIDQVHEEMRPRFDGVMQVGREIAREGLARLAAAVALPPTALTKAPAGWQMAPWPTPERTVVVFNPTPTRRTDRVEVEVRLPGLPEQVVLVAPDGNRLPAHWLYRPETLVREETRDGAGLRDLLARAAAGHFFYRRIRSLHLRVDGSHADLDLLLHDDERAPDMTALHDVLARIAADAALDDVATATIRTQTMATGRLAFVAPDIPGHGYRAFRLVATEGEVLPPATDTPATIENEQLRLTADPVTATLTLEERATGRRLPALLRLVDGGDAGDEYSYSPPAIDRIIAAPEAPATVAVEQTATAQTLTLRYTLALPAALTADRQGRSTETVPLAVTVRASLVPGVARLDVELEVENQAANHRLRAHLPLAGASRAWSESHLDVVARPTTPPAPEPTWAEDPPATFPQRGWSAIEDEAGNGLLVAVRGLYEAETTPDAAGDLALKLTLLRCVGDLSRADLTTRRGHAGPTCATPGAQEPGSHRFALSVVPYRGGWQRALPVAAAFRAPLVAASAAPGTGPLPPEASLLAIAPAEVALSAVKLPEDGSAGLVVRLWNPTDQPLAVTVRPLFPLRAASRSDLRERVGAPLEVTANSVALNLRPREIATLRLDLAPPA